MKTVRGERPREDAKMLVLRYIAGEWVQMPARYVADRVTAADVANDSALRGLTWVEVRKLGLEDHECAGVAIRLDTYADPTAEAREGISVDDALVIMREDPGLVHVVEVQS